MLIGTLIPFSTFVLGPIILFFPNIVPKIFHFGVIKDKIIQYKLRIRKDAMNHLLEYFKRELGENEYSKSIDLLKNLISSIDKV